jgi:uncharacterized protein (TIGR02145 family)
LPSIDDINVNINSGDTINLTPTNGGGINNSDVVPPNTIYSWANNNTSIGLAASGTGADLIFTLTNSGTTPMVAQIIVIPSTGSCQGESFTITLTINPSTAAPLPNVIIGTQIWTNTNLDVTTYRDGTPIPQVTDPTAWAGLTTGAWCYYNNDPANGAIYGKLYNWYAVAGIHDNDPATPNKILAPTGWHIATDAEWTSLTDFLGGANVAGKKLKDNSATSTWDVTTHYATNQSGFSALPAGVGYLNYSLPPSPAVPALSDLFKWKKKSAYLWTSTQGNSAEYNWVRDINSTSDQLVRSGAVKSSALSVRCVKN